MIDAKPRVVVLMATYNGAAHVEDQIRSILSQRDVDVRLIVRDDGSTDDTPAILRRLTAVHDGDVEIMDSAGHRCGTAAGNFFELLRTFLPENAAWVALADQDDVWFPDKLVRAVEKMRTDNADGYSSNLLAFSDDAHRAWQVRKDAAPRRFDYLFQGASAGCTYVISPRALSIVRAGLGRMRGPVPPHASHDWLIYALCRSAGLRWTLDDHARIAYRQHAGNVYGTKSGFGRVLERAQLLRSSWYRNAILWLRTLLELSPAEQQIVTRVERLTVLDRLWLARRAAWFRRDPGEVRQLRLALLSGFFR